MLRSAETHASGPTYPLEGDFEVYRLLGLPEGTGPWAVLGLPFDSPLHDVAARAGRLDALIRGSGYSEPEKRTVRKLVQDARRELSTPYRRDPVQAAYYGIERDMMAEQLRGGYARGLSEADWRSEVERRAAASVGRSHAPAQQPPEPAAEDGLDARAAAWRAWQARHPPGVRR